MMPELPEQIDLRAHHLFTLHREEALSHLPDLVRDAVRAGVRARYWAMGYERDPEFSDHLMEIMDGILEGRIKSVRIVDEHDAVCEQCPQRQADHCKIQGIKYGAGFLRRVDHVFAQEAGIVIGETYTAEELLGHMANIRSAILAGPFWLHKLLKDPVTTE